MKKEDLEFERFCEYAKQNTGFSSYDCGDYFNIRFYNEFGGIILEVKSNHENEEELMESHIETLAYHYMDREVVVS